MEVANVVLKQVAEFFMVYVKRHLSYYISCKKYVNDMDMKMRELKATRLGVEQRLDQHNTSRLEVPAQAGGWLEDVGKIEEEVKAISSDFGRCFNFQMRHKLGRTAFKINEKIDSVTRTHSSFNWTNLRIPLAKVDSMKASTSMSSTDHPDDFESREQTFTEALKALKPQHQKSHMIALCGMGGVGKTTMMHRLKKAVKETKMFEYIVEAVLGATTDTNAIQEAVANYLSLELKETTKSARADRLREWFKAKSDGGKTKFLIVLDDVWQVVDLNDIGLSRLPNQGVNFKVLLTSRDRHVCSTMGVEVDSILNVDLLREAEAQRLFRQFSGIVDHEVHKIGEDIVRKCRGLPLAIKTMACTLKDRGKDAWKDALSRLEHHDVDTVVNKVFELSYDNLQPEETKFVFLLCGLFPEDFDIPTECLVRYGWGLRLFKKVSNITEARSRLNTCIERLFHTNLLIGGDYVGCVKMHDLVLAFVLNMFSKVEHASVVNHGSMLGWSENDMSKFPNLSLLKLMHGDKSMSFPQDFYREMEKLQVISYDIMKCRLPPLLPQCSTNLRVLHLHECSLKFDFSSIGNLLNLEVLSFANSGIEWLPSTFRNLKKLRLLDLTGCNGLGIDSGVLKELVSLEELYMKIKHYGNWISFTDDNCNEMVERSENLFALEFEFFNNNVQPKNMSFGKLQRFRISMGCSFWNLLRFEISMGCSFSNHGGYFLENELQLMSNKYEVVESKINELFEKTNILVLTVRDMNDLEDVHVKSSSHPHQSFSFHNLRVLVVSECSELRYLFTFGVANTLSKLECLEVYKCDNMEELIHIGCSGKDKITFPKLKFLCLHSLPSLKGLCDNVNVVELPQLLELKLEDIPGFTSIYPTSKLETSSFLQEEVIIPKLEKLCIDGMKNLKKIWACGFGTSEEVNVSTLREIKVRYCDSLVSLFPCNPMPLIRHLEQLKVHRCNSIEVLFDIDLDRVGEIGEGSSNSSLRSIVVEDLEMLREVWGIKGAYNSGILVRGFQAVENIRIKRCGRFRNICTPVTKSLDLGALLEISILDCGENWRNGESGESSQEPINILSEEEETSKINILSEEEETSEINILSQEEDTSNNDDIMSNVVVPSSLIHSFPNLRRLGLRRCKRVEVVFEIESPRSREFATTQESQQLLPYLETLDIDSMPSLHHIWKCNWNEFLILQKQQSESSFHNLATICLIDCKSIKYLFSPLMAKLFSNLKKVEIQNCDGIEEIVSNRDDEDEDEENTTTFTSTSTHTSTTLFPCLDSLALSKLPNLKYIGGGGRDNIANNETSFSNSTTNTVFVDPLKNSQAGGVSWTLCQFAREIQISHCDALSSVIPCYAVGQMQKIQVLRVDFCNSVKEVFETQGINSNNSGSGDGNGCTPAAIPRLNNSAMLQLANLKILQITGCDCLEHISTFSALESLRQLQELDIRDCKAMTVIMKKEDGEAPKAVVFPRLRSIYLDSLPELVGFFLGMNEFSWPSLDKINILSQEEDTLNNDDSMSNVVVPSSLIHSFPNLRKLDLWRCERVEVVFEIESPRSREFATTQENQQLLPYLETLDIYSMPSLHHIWKCNWNEFLILQKQQSESSFHNLATICLTDCKSIKYLFSPLMAKLFSNLKKVELINCDGIEEVVSNRDDEDEDEENTAFTSTSAHTSTTLFPCLDSLVLTFLPNLKYIGGGGRANIANNETSFSNSTTNTVFVDPLKNSQAGGVSWSLCQFAREIDICECDALSSVIPCYAAGQMQKIQVLRVRYCLGMKEVFETQGINSNNSGSGDGNGCTPAAIPRLNNNNGAMLQLANLKTLVIVVCHCLEHIFTFSAVESLRQLEELQIHQCRAMTVIMKKEDGEQTAVAPKAVVFPRLKSIELVLLPELVGFFLGMNKFHWPSLDMVKILECPKMTVFAPGGSTTPNLKYIHTSLGKHSVECGLNFHLTTTAHPHHQNPFPSLDGASSSVVTSGGTPWSFHNLIELDVYADDFSKTIVPSNELVQLQKLEKIRVRYCFRVEGIFEALEAGTDSTGSQATVVKLPNLTQVNVLRLLKLRCIWKSNQWTVFVFPNLTILSIVDCKSLQHVFTNSMLGSLLQLQELHISNCDSMKEVIVKDSKGVVEEEDEKEEEEGDETEEENEEEDEKEEEDETEEEEDEKEEEDEEDDETEEEEDETEEEESDCEISEITLPRLKSLQLIPDTFNIEKEVEDEEDDETEEEEDETEEEESDCEISEITLPRLKSLQLILDTFNIEKEVEDEEDDETEEEEDETEEEESDCEISEITLPRLKSLRLVNLRCLKGFCLGKKDFSFPLLDDLRIVYCPSITTFTNGNVVTPQLKGIEISRGSFYDTRGKDINSFIKLNQKEIKKFSGFHKETATWKPFLI